MSEFRIDFSKFEWEKSPLGSHYKALEKGGKKIRLVEIRKSDGEADWCTNGHIGYVISGELEISFSESVVNYKAGDGIYIPDGDEAKHKPRAISEIVSLFFVEKI